MAEYIERDEAIRKSIDACIKVVGHGITQFDAVDIAEMMDSIPNADVVDVVRCKDCNYRVPISEQQYLYRGKTAMHCILHSRLCRENDFCSYGERKDGVTDTNVGKMDGKGGAE